MTQPRQIEILVVEDDADTRQSLQEILELDDYRVETAGSIAEVLRQNDCSRFAVVLLDRKLPDGMADEFLPRLQELAPQAAIIVITGYADLNSALVALRLGAADYILKPINPDALRARLRRIVEEMLTKTALQQSQQRMQALFDCTLEAIFLTNDQGTCLDANPAAEALLGYRRDELQKLSLRDVVVETEQERFATLWEVLPINGPRTDEFTMLRKDGGAVTVEYHAVANIIPGLHLAVLRDVTALKQAQQRVLQSERLAAIGEAMTGLAHESRNALQRSQASLEMLARRVLDRPDLVELIGRIQRAQDDLHQLYEEVREYAAPVRYNYEICDLGEVARESWDHLKPLWSQRDVQFRVESNGIDPRCEADRFALRQVFRNVLENALCACTDPTEIDVRFCAENVGGRPGICVALRNNGPPLTPEQKLRIFDAFYTTKTHGTGLGMAICKRFVDAHCGQIQVGPADDCGMELRITLPEKQT